jgi:hypothetical protein
MRPSPGTPEEPGKGQRDKGSDEAVRSGRSDALTPNARTGPMPETRSAHLRGLPRKAAPGRAETLSIPRPEFDIMD